MKNCQVYSQNSCTSLHLDQQWRSVPLVPKCSYLRKKYHEDRWTVTQVSEECWLDLSMCHHLHVLYSTRCQVVPVSGCFQSVLYVSGQQYKFRDANVMAWVSYIPKVADVRCKVQTASMPEWFLICLSSILESSSLLE